MRRWQSHIDRLLVPYPNITRTVAGPVPPHALIPQHVREIIRWHCRVDWDGPTTASVAVKRIALPPKLETRADYLIALHEIGHVETTFTWIWAFDIREWYGEPIAEAEADAWMWALEELDRRGDLREEDWEIARLALASYDADCYGRRDGYYWKAIMGGPSA